MPPSTAVHSYPDKENRLFVGRENSKASAHNKKDIDTWTKCNRDLFPRASLYSEALEFSLTHLHSINPLLEYILMEDVHTHLQLPARFHQASLGIAKASHTILSNPKPGRHPSFKLLPKSTNEEFLYGIFIPPPHMTYAYILRQAIKDLSIIFGKDWIDVEDIYLFMETYVLNLPKLFKPAALNALQRATDKNLFIRHPRNILVYRVNDAAQLEDYYSNRGRHSSYRRIVARDPSFEGEFTTQFYRPMQAAQINEMMMMITPFDTTPSSTPPLTPASRTSSVEKDSSDDYDDMPEFDGAAVLDMMVMDSTLLCETEEPPLSDDTSSSSLFVVDWASPRNSNDRPSGIGNDFEWTPLGGCEDYDDEDGVIEHDEDLMIWTQVESLPIEVTSY